MIWPEFVIVAVNSFVLIAAYPPPLDIVPEFSIVLGPKVVPPVAMEIP
jgi:hypothetical protein